MLVSFGGRITYNFEIFIFQTFKLYIPLIPKILYLHFRNSKNKAWSLKCDPPSQTANPQAFFRGETSFLLHFILKKKERKRKQSLGSLSSLTCYVIKG